jgi:hypothetical protein
MYANTTFYLLYMLAAIPSVMHCYDLYYRHCIPTAIQLCKRLHTITLQFHVMQQGSHLVTAGTTSRSLIALSTLTLRAALLLL